MTENNNPVWTRVIDNKVFVAVNFIPDSDKEQEVELQLGYDKAPQIVKILKKIENRTSEYWDYKVWGKIIFSPTDSKLIYINQSKRWDWEFIWTTIDKEKKIYLNIEEDNRNCKRWKIKVKQLDIDKLQKQDEEEEEDLEEVVF